MCAGMATQGGNNHAGEERQWWDNKIKVDGWSISSVHASV